MGGILSRSMFLCPRGHLSRSAVARLGGTVDHVRTIHNSVIPVVVFPEPGSPSGRPTIIISHGNNEELSTAHLFAHDVCRRTGCRVVMYDYTGYGSAYPAMQTTAGMAKADVFAVLSYTTQVLGARSVVLMGYSIGTGPTCYASALGSRLVHGVVLVSPFVAALRVRGPRWFQSCVVALLGEPFPNEQNLARLPASCPLMIIHGVDDRVIDVSHGRRLYLNHITRRGNAQCLWVPDAGHQLDDLMGVAFWNALRDVVADAPAYASRIATAPPCDDVRRQPVRQNGYSSLS